MYLPQIPSPWKNVRKWRLTYVFFLILTHLYIKRLFLLGRAKNSLFDAVYIKTKKGRNSIQIIERIWLFFY